MKNILLLVSGLLPLICYSAGNSISKCATVEAIAAREQEHSGYQDAIKSSFERARQEASRGSRNADEVYRIQTVVHIVYSTAQQNLPDSLVYSQIEVLNRDYRRLNPDTVDTRPDFLPVAADTKIEFVLATIDPDGNPTSGITRTQGNPGFLGFNPFNDNVKASSTGGKDPWPTDRYLNIWVCDILFGLGVLGYAFPPADLPNWPAGTGTDSAKQGVVIHFASFGKNNPYAISPEVAGGRTAVHEVGHYLGLRHVWGDDQGACAGAANAGSDGIDDTPDTGDSQQQQCNLNSNTCGAGNAGDLPDMIENYMDYSDERCQNMFTVEQVALMRSILTTYRSGIILTQGVGFNHWDFSVAKIYPNPAKDRIYGMNSESLLNVFDMSGRLIKTALPDNSGSVNLEELQPGSYVLSWKEMGKLRAARLQLLP